MAAIIGKSILRIFLMPLTQWETLCAERGRRLVCPGPPSGGRSRCLLHGCCMALLAFTVNFTYQ